MDPIIKYAEILADSIRKDKRNSDADDESRTFQTSTYTKIVGQDQDKKLLIAELLSDKYRREVIPITGMPYIGKTTLARSIFEDPDIESEFPYRAWVTISPDYNLGEILAKLLSSVESRGQKGGEKMWDGSEGESTLTEKLHQTLYNNKYLVVIDDLWDDKSFTSLLNSLPANENKSRILVTTRILDVAKSIKSYTFLHMMQPLNEEDSWTLLRLRTFEGAPCPPHLEKIGKQIAKNCEGLPLTLKAVGGLLAQKRVIEEYWRSIAQDISIATNDVKIEDSYKEILSLSYDSLPPNLKGCFLYMAAFPVDAEILVSKLVKLWVAEGFLTPPSPPQSMESVAERSLLHLIDRNLIFVRKISPDGRIKTCGMDSNLLKLAQKEAEKEKFIYSIKSQGKKLEEGAESQRRVSVHETAVMCRRRVYESTKSIKHARSLLYVDPSYPHPLPFYLTFHLLRVFDAFTVLFYEFPHEIIQLIHLRYLSFTYNGRLPSSISKLRNLQILMVRRKPKIIMVGLSFLPEEIWNMGQLRHLIFTESDLPFPLEALLTEESSPLLENLQSLSSVNAANLTEKVIRQMPNLRKLGMWLESPQDLHLHLKHVKKLEAFTLMVLKPVCGKPVNLLGDGLFFPETLRKLSLSGCGLPWEDMKVIEKLPNLEVLKLRELAFHGDEWCPTYVFKRLKYLLIEYLNLKWLETDGSHFPALRSLILRHCYELEGIPTDIGVLGHIELIELVDCSPDAVQAVEDINEEC